MFSARQNWSTVKLGSLTSALARFAVRAGLCSKDTLRLHVYSYVGPCITVDAEKIRAEIFRRLGRRVLMRFKRGSVLSASRQKRRKCCVAGLTGCAMALNRSGATSSRAGAKSLGLGDHVGAGRPCCTGGAVCCFSASKWSSLSGCSTSASCCRRPQTMRYFRPAS